MDYNLERFEDAQFEHINIALKELKEGKKQTCWIWYIFPQIKGLGQSENSKYYGINSLEEASAYLKNMYLSKNLTLCINALLDLKTRNLEDVMSPLDAQKVHSCLTLFWLVANKPLFDLIKEALYKFWQGSLDKETLKIIGQ